MTLAHAAILCVALAICTVFGLSIATFVAAPAPRHLVAGRP